MAYGWDGQALPGNWAGLVFHHTAGHGTVQGVIDTLRQKGLGAQYIIDRDANIIATGLPSAHIRPPYKRFGKVGRNLSNSNSIGVEVMANDDRDILPSQVEAAKRIYAVYPNATVFGHGQLDPGHRQPTEGQTIIQALAALRTGGQPPGSTAPIAYSAPAPRSTTSTPAPRAQPTVAPNDPLAASLGYGPNVAVPPPQQNTDQVSAMIDQLLNPQSQAQNQGILGGLFGGQKGQSSMLNSAMGALSPQQGQVPQSNARAEAAAMGQQMLQLQQALAQQFLTRGVR